MSLYKHGCPIENHECGHDEKIEPNHSFEEVETRFGQIKCSVHSRTETDFLEKPPQESTKGFI